MFEGGKTSIFYTGLLILGGSLFAVFLTLWIILIDVHSYAWKIVTPFVFGQQSS